MQRIATVFPQRHQPSEISVHSGCVQNLTSDTHCLHQLLYLSHWCPQRILPPLHFHALLEVVEERWLLDDATTWHTGFPFPTIAVALLCDFIVTAITATSSNVAERLETSIRLDGVCKCECIVKASFPAKVLRHTKAVV